MKPDMSACIQDLLAEAERQNKWIKGAISKPHALRRALHIKASENIPVKKLRNAAKASGKMGKRARLALTLKGFRR